MKPSFIHSTIAFLIFLTCKPYFIWSIDYIISPYISLLIGVLLLPFIMWENKNCMVSLAIFLFTYFVLSLTRGAHLIGTFIYLSLGFLPCIRRNDLMKIFTSFKAILCMVLAFSLVTYLLLFLGFPFRANIISPINTVKTFEYLQYPLLVTPFHGNSDVLEMFRFCSVFDEPGVVGTICALLLIVEHCNIKSTSNIVFLIAGILSFSLFFYLLLVLYLLIISSNRGKLFLLCSLLVFYSLTSNNDYFVNVIWGRLIIGPDYNISGNNRNTDELLNLYDISKTNFRFLIGYGDNYVSNYIESASIQLFILRDGLIFVFFFFLSFLSRAIAVLKSFWIVLLFFIVLFCTLYQRPGFCEQSFILLFAAIMYSMSHNSYHIINAKSAFQGQIN